MVQNFPYLRSNAKVDKWKWVYSIKDKKDIVLNPSLIHDRVETSNLLQTYGLKKIPKSLPCNKKCNLNPWCLANILKENTLLIGQLTEQVRDMDEPVGLQNTANTCWINSALQALFHIYQFRNTINSIEGFKGEESLNSLEYLLQAMFVEMELHKHKALACATGNVFEKLAIYVTKEIMQKDQDFEVLKCVSEFLENTIDSLLGNPRIGSQFSPIFRTTIYRVAKWKCSSCGREHVKQLNPDTCYTMAAYVSGDECPLGQCILDLQTETQTGVSLVCGEDGGCGATVRVDRVVTPKILSLPSLLIIRNNSLIDNEIKRRLHVVYPESLDLTPFMCTKEPAIYSLRAVIYHHGHWIKHFSAHVKTEAGKWFNFNDEKVNSLVKRSGNCIPLETHKDYFSVANVANKYRNRPNLRVSRGAFIWIYERNSSVKGSDFLEPPNDVVDYVLSNQKDKQTADGYLLEKLKKDRENLFKKLAVANIHEEVSLVSRSVISSWLRSSEIKYVPQPSILAEGICEHIKFDPLKANSFRCIRKDQVNSLLNSEYGIHSEHKIPLVFSKEDGFCGQCVAKHAHHIIFREYLKELNKNLKKESSKEQKDGTIFVGAETVANWMSLVVNIYMKETGLDDMERSLEDDADSNGKSHSEEDGNEEELTKDPLEITESVERDLPDVGCSSSSSLSSKENGKDINEAQFSSFNEDIVCPHDMHNPQAPGVWVPCGLVEEVKKFCAGAVHPVAERPNFAPCTVCKDSREKILALCDRGKVERKQLYYLFVERRRPNPNKDVDQPLYLLSREFLSEWKSFVRQCVKEGDGVSRPDRINNSSLLCKHNQLLYSCSPKSSLFDFCIIIWEQEWKCLSEFYPFDYCVEIRCDQSGQILPGVGICEEGCVEIEAARLFEDQFTYEHELINIRQVNSATDVPASNSTSYNSSDEGDDDDALPKKKPRIAALSSASLRAATQKLVRASKTFSSSDTIREIQNFIAERTKIWPFLQTLWLSGGKEHGPDPFLLSEEQRSMTLSALRIKPGDTIYFRAAMEDMEKAAGDGETEYSEVF